MRRHMRKHPDIDIRLAEDLFGLKGVGYYGPTKAHGGHLDNKLMTKEEAFDAYVDLWPEESQPNTADDVSLCSWREDWGPIFVPEYSTWISDAWEVVDEVNKKLTGFQLEKTKNGWKASWILKPGMWPFAAEGVVGFANTPEVAICIAALEYCKHRGKP